MRCPHAYSDGAYVLGALSPAERSAYQAHLAECDACARAVAALAPMPGLLGRVDPAVLQPAEPESERLPQLLAAVAAKRRRQARIRRWQLAAASLVTAAVAATGVAVADGAGWVGSADEPPAELIAMTPVDRSLPVTAEVAVAPAPGGSEVWMSCRYEGDTSLPPHPYWLVAYGTDGTHESLGSWEVAAGQEITMTGRTRYQPDELERLELQGVGGDTLLIYQRR
ncbi:MAG TPA: zf-HC2 domain-containing protein [Natronosporangium sp.]